MLVNVKRCTCCFNDDAAAAAAAANDDDEQHQHEVADSQLGGRGCLRVRDSGASFGGTRIHRDTTTPYRQ